MLNARFKKKRSHTLRGSRAAVASSSTSSMSRSDQIGGSVPHLMANHPLINQRENAELYDYENRIKSAFDHIVPALKKISALQHEENFEAQAQNLAQQLLGFKLPEHILADAWIQQLDMKPLYAWCLFETYKRFCDDFYQNNPLSNNDSKEQEFQRFLLECGFHTLDLTPCSDGRLAHVIRYVLRMPYKMVRRKSYAGALFEIEDSLDKWVETELKRYREGKPDTSDSATRYLKTVVYHHSSVDPLHEGCAAHGSDNDLAAKAGAEKLDAFKKSIENTHCCGASIEQLLIGLDTDTDSIRIHLTDASGEIDLEQFIDATDMYQATSTMSAEAVKGWIMSQLEERSPSLADGMKRFMTYLLMNNMSQIAYVKQYHGQSYKDIGHAERFIGAGIGFEEVQLRNLTYFAYLNTVEEATNDLDVGIKIFSGLNANKGLPIPIVVRYDYHGNVPGSKERAKTHCHRVNDAINNRYQSLKEQGLIHSLLAIRDVNISGNIEVLDCSVKAERTAGAH